MKEKKQELELSILQEVNGKWQHKILDRPATDKLCTDALAEIDQEDAEMTWSVKAAYFLKSRNFLYTWS